MLSLGLSCLQWKSPFLVCNSAECVSIKQYIKVRVTSLHKRKAYLQVFYSKQMVFTTAITNSKYCNNGTGLACTVTRVEAAGKH